VNLAFSRNCAAARNLRQSEVINAQRGFARLREMRYAEIRGDNCDGNMFPKPISVEDSLRVLHVASPERGSFAGWLA
jgi:hypothetical protein